MLLFSKGLTLGDQRRRHEPHDADNDLAGRRSTSSDGSETVNSPALDAAHLLRPLLREGEGIKFLDEEGRISTLELLRNVTDTDVRCCGASRGLRHRAIGKHTDVYIVDGRVTRQSEGVEVEAVPAGRYVVKTCSARDQHEVKMIQRLRALHLPPSIDERIPVVLASSTVLLAQNDPFTSLLSKARSDAQLRAAFDNDTLSALRDVCPLYLTVYEAETFGLHSLLRRHALAVIADAAFTLIYLWNEVRFIHRDVSDSNIASKYSAADLIGKDASIEELLKTRLAILDQAAASALKEPWWQLFANDDMALCVILDPENACFATRERKHMPRGKAEEIQAIISGTPIYGSQVDWLVREQAKLEFSHHAGDGLESLLYVLVGLAAEVEKQRLQDQRRGWVNRPPKNISAIVRGPCDDFDEVSSFRSEVAVV